MKLNKEIAIKHTTQLATFLLIAWGLFRMLFKLDEEIEEFIIKPIVWLIPVFYLVKKEKLGFSSLGITTKNLFPSVYYALGLGALFALEGVVVNIIKHDTISFNANLPEQAFVLALLLSLATAISEEITFRGYIFNRLSYALGNELTANIVSSVVWGLIHIPFAIFWLELDFLGSLGFFILMAVFGVGSAFVFSRTKNVASSILLHMLWAWPIMLFR